MGFRRLKGVEAHLFHKLFVRVWVFRFRKGKLGFQWGAVHRFFLRLLRSPLSSWAKHPEQSPLPKPPAPPSVSSSPHGLLGDMVRRWWSRSLNGLGCQTCMFLLFVHWLCFLCIVVHMMFLKEGKRSTTFWRRQRRNEGGGAQAAERRLDDARALLERKNGTMYSSFAMV